MAELERRETTLDFPSFERLWYRGGAGLACSYCGLRVLDSYDGLRAISRCCPSTTAGTTTPEQEGTSTTPAATAAASSAGTTPATPATTAQTGTETQPTGTRRRRTGQLVYFLNYLTLLRP